LKKEAQRRRFLQLHGAANAPPRRILATLQHKSLFRVGRQTAGTPLAHLYAIGIADVRFEAEKRGWHREGEEGRKRSARDAPLGLSNLALGV